MKIFFWFFQLFQGQPDPQPAPRNVIQRNYSIGPFDFAEVA